MSARSTPNRFAHHRKGRTSPLVWVLILMSSMLLGGIIFTIFTVPAQLSNTSAYTTNSMLARANQIEQSISAKIMSWLPHKSHAGIPHDIEDILPDWDNVENKFWTPIDLDTSYPNDPTVTLCHLNFKEYANAPHLYPMFRDLESASSCNGNNKRKEKLSVLMNEIKANEGNDKLGRVIKPNAFVFHESRVGSTLVANTLGSDPWALVFSESAPAASALLHCSSCSRQKNVQMFRDIVTLMGRSPFHKRLFFKFQSITSTKMDIALEAFPDTPWMFVYRQPVQTMMSHLDPNKGSAGAPCLRSMRDPPKEVKDTLASAIGNSANAPKEAWCAAHLNMLCSHALDAYDKYSVIKKSNGDVIQRGFLINYESLPGIVPSVLLPLFGITTTPHWLSKMAVESTQYSKGRKSGAKVFTGDSADKEERATHNIQKYAKEILQPNFDRMNEIYTGILRTFSPLNTPTNEELKIVPTVPVPAKEKYYTDALNIIENSHGGQLGGDIAAGHTVAEGHSAFDKGLTREYLPWIPFSNVHTSKSFDKVNCPDIPDGSYPKTYAMSDMTANWNTDVTDIPPFHYDSLCHFDYQNATDNAKILAYRSAEVPFVVYNIPEVDTVVKNWNNLDYLHKKLGKKAYRTETSKTNHFMYWHSTGKNLRGKDGKKWEPPTDIINEQFEQWLEVLTHLLFTYLLAYSHSITLSGGCQRSE